MPVSKLLRQPTELDGTGGILKISMPDGDTVYTVGVPQDWYSPTGPTWIYIVDHGSGLGLMDAGSVLAQEYIEDAFNFLKMSISDVDRIVITHSHLDHDGGAQGLSEISGGEVWTHDLYDHLRFVSFKEMNSNFHPMLWKTYKDAGPNRQMNKNDRPDSDRHKKYEELRKNLKISKTVSDGETANGFTFFHTPGHTADELTIKFGSMFFTGDHVLPEISPHPTMKASFQKSILDSMPKKYKNVESFFGLETYIRSLARVAEYGEKAIIMPAHRLVNKGKINVMTALRAQSIIEHHVQRIHKILSLMGTETMNLENITRKLFSHFQLDGGSYQAAVSETFAHLELLMDSDDIGIVEEEYAVWNGTENYKNILKNYREI